MALTRAHVRRGAPIACYASLMGLWGLFLGDQSDALERFCTIPLLGWWFAAMLPSCGVGRSNLLPPDAGSFEEILGWLADDVQCRECGDRRPN